MKILTIFTGGTIGCLQGDNYGLDVSEETMDMLVNRYHKSREDGVEFTVKSPFFSLSESRTPDEFAQLVKAVTDNLQDTHQGVLITHGTDTMPFAASAVAYALAHLNIPIVFTGANYPIDDRRSNGFRNFVSAVDFIKASTQNAPRSGVYVVYENNHDHRTLVHLGTRLLEAEAFNDEFSSLGGIYFGEMIEGKFHRHQDRINPSTAEIKVPRPETRGAADAAFSDEVMVIVPYPGLRYDYYTRMLEERPPKAILHALHHAGTASVQATEGSPYCLKEFILRCQEKGVRVYSCPSREKLMVEKYITANTLVEAGLIPLENIAMPAAIVKVMMAHSLYKNQADINAFLKQDINFEFVDFRRVGYGKHRRQR